MCVDGRWGDHTTEKFVLVSFGSYRLCLLLHCPSVQVLGAQKRTLAGFSTATILPHTGFIFYSDLVQSTPPVSFVVVAVGYFWV